MDMPHLKERTKKFLEDNQNKLLVLLISFAAIIRLYYFFKVGEQPIWWDEGDYLAVAKGFAQHWQNQEWWVHFSGIRPMLIPMIWYVFFLFNFSELTMRFFTLLIPSVASVYLTYAIGRDLYDKRTGLIAGLMLSVYWVHLFYTFRLLSDIPSLFFGLLSIYFFWSRYIKKNESRGLYYAILFGILGFSTRFPLAIVPIIYPIYLLFIKKFELVKDKTFWKAMIFGVVVLVIYFGISSLFGSGITTAFKFYLGESAVSTKNVLTDNISVLGRMVASLFGSDILLQNVWFLTLVVGLVELVYLILGFDLFLKQKDKNANSNFFVFLWVVLHLLFYMVIIRSANDRWLLMLMPPLFFISSKGILFLYDNLKKYNKEIAIFALLALILGGMYQNMKHADLLIEVKESSYGEEKLAGIYIKENFNGQEKPKIITASTVQIAYYSEGYTYGFYTEDPEFTNCVDILGGVVNNETCQKTTEELFRKKVKELKPDFLILHGFEPVFTPQWAYNYPSKYKDELEPVQAYFADQERTQPMLIVYKFKNENI